MIVKNSGAAPAGRSRGSLVTEITDRREGSEKVVGSELEACLESLAALRQAMGDECELIIADTGSTDNTAAIAKNYADKFLTVPWNDDFAEARNETLKTATGEWFMFIDADEELIGGDEIAEFFLSGEYKNYNSATYIQRNFSDLKGSSYTDYRPGRLTKILPDTCFEGNVHEALRGFGEPIKHFGAYVNHFGYVSDGGKKLEKARERLRQLEKGLEGTADINKRLLILCEMSDAAKICDPVRAAKLDLEGLELSQNPDAYYYVKYVFGSKCAERLLSAKRYKEAALMVSNLLANRGNAENEYERMAMANDIDLYAILALSLFSMKRYAETAQLLYSYGNLLTDYFSGELFSADYYFNTPSYIAPANIKKCDDIIGSTRIKLKNNPEAAKLLSLAHEILQKHIRGEK
jgi:glycosyltransferase involved in cell wall biosynthesis